MKEVPIKQRTAEVTIACPERLTVFFNHYQSVTFLVFFFFICFIYLTHTINVAVYEVHKICMLTFVDTKSEFLDFF